MDGALARLEVEGPVATVTLDSPRNRNALSRRLLADLAAGVESAVADPAVRVIVLTGAGPAFCAGADLKEQRESGGGTSLAALPEVMTALWNAPQPVVCKLNGPARAGGVGLAASCDLVVAPDNVSFSFTEVRLGLVPAIITVPLLRRMPAQIVHRLYLTAEEFDADRAEEFGLIDVVAPLADLDAVVGNVVGMLLRGAPEAMAITKRLAHTVGSLAPAEGFERMAALSADRFVSGEGREGMLAFAEKRDPAWVPDAGRA